jgi:hypothetical protein
MNVPRGTLLFHACMREKSAADWLSIRIATAIPDVRDDVVDGNEAEGKKRKDEVHNLLLFLVANPYTIVDRV